ncbi:apolipoprotein N-acyltransferase, partial [bacterium]
MILVSSIWIIIEWLQGMTEAGFTFGRLAISQYNYLPIIQSSALFGTLFISGLMVAFNAASALTLIQLKKVRAENQKLNLKPLMIVISILLLNIGYGFYTINSKTDLGETINVGIVQGNIASGDKWKTPLEVHMKTYSDLTEKLITDNRNTKMDMIVWPETAIPFFFNHPYVTNELKAIAQSEQVYFMTGILTTRYSAEEAEKIGWVNLHEHSNSLIGIDKNGNPSNIYSKRHLVPFGEYMPFRFILEKIAPGLNKLNALKGDLIPGIDTGIITTPFGKVGGLICYESIFPQIIRASVLDGAQLLVLPTNDSWFKDSAAVYQHNAQAVFRSVETDRYMVRAANTGISSIISPVGEIIGKTQPLEKAVLTGKVKFRNTITLYTRIGDIIVLLALISILTIY